MVWSSLAEDMVARLIANTPPVDDPWVRTNAERLDALPLSWNLWTFSFLRPNGEVVVVNSEPDYFEPKEDISYRDRGHVIQALVLATRRYPDLVNLLPAREPDASDCPCRTVPLLATGKVVCSLCGGLGWLPDPNSNEVADEL